MKGQTYWGRLAGGSIFLLAIAAVQILRISSSGVSLLAALMQYLILVVVVFGVFGIVVGVYWSRGAAARKRRKTIDLDASRQWIGDLTTDQGTFDSMFVLSRADRSVPRSYALVGGPRGLELWGDESMGEADATIPYSKIVEISAPLNGSARGAGDFEVHLMDQSTLSFHLISQKFAGSYPASPRQVDDLVARTRDLVTSGATGR